MPAIQSCSFPGCMKSRRALGLCPGHYAQRRRGAPLTPLKAIAPRPQREPSPDAASRRPCSFLGCAELTRARGLCGGHYQQWRMNKPLTPLQQARTPRRKNLSDAGLMEHIRCQSRHAEGPLNTPCLLWNGASNTQGYGTIQFNGRRMSLHRWVYAHHHGPIPSGFIICHHCDTPACIELTHLYAGTTSDNQKDRWRRTGFKRHALAKDQQTR